MLKKSYCETYQLSAVCSDGSGGSGGSGGGGGGGGGGGDGS